MSDSSQLLTVVRAYALVILQLELLEVARPHHLRIHCPLTTIASRSMPLQRAAHMCCKVSASPELSLHCTCFLHSVLCSSSSFRQRSTSISLPDLRDLQAESLLTSVLLNGFCKSCESGFRAWPEEGRVVMSL
jgi:hypothetical protein